MKNAIEGTFRGSAKTHPTIMNERQLRQTDNLRDLFLHDVPLLDVRAPVEFAEGAFPMAENHPLMDDDERHEIGVMYSAQGQQRAIELGERLVSGPLRRQRIAAWRYFIERHPNAVLYCFRGGKRSQIAQRWLNDDARIECARVKGGYKAMRRFLLAELETNAQRCRPVVIGGRTGVGKTRLLVTCDAFIDLEGYANHRGSAFGRHPQPQPTQINFENRLSIRLMKQVAHGNRPFVVEDESRNIGSRHVPIVFFNAMEAAPIVLLEASDEERIDITLQEYVCDARAEFDAVYGEAQGFDRWAAYLGRSLDRIRKRLGGERYRRATTALQTALTQQRRDGRTEGHRAWIGVLLTEYYDGMYNYQLDGKRERIAFRGTRSEVRDFLAERFDIRHQAEP